MFRKIIVEGGLELYDKYHNLVVENILSNHEWQEEAGENFQGEFEEWWSLMNGDDIDAVTNELSEGMQNLQLPVFTRWHTIIPSIKSFLKNNVVIYFFALTIKQKETSGSYLHNCACDIIGLMNIRAKKGASPTLVTQMHFINGFANAVYGNSFAMACRPDLKFGSDSQGHISHLCVERCFVMKDQILELNSENGLKNAGSFTQYLKSLANIPSLGGVNEGGSELFAKIEEVFFEEFLASYSDHVESVWRSNAILPFILGGNPRLAQLFACWLFYHFESSGANDIGNTDEFVWPDENIELKSHHMTADKKVIVNTADCMRYLTANADPFTILEDPMIKMETDLLWRLGAAESPIDLFDKTTWGDGDFTPLQNIVHTIIAIQPTQNQQVENHVQLTALVRKTNCGEARATARTMIHSYLIRRYNADSVAVKKATVLLA